MKVENQKVIGIEYTLKDSKGEILDSNAGQERLYFVQGLGNIVPGLEKAMLGKSLGDTFEVEVKAAEGYGMQDASLIRRVPRAKMKSLGDVKVGAMLQSRGPEGEQIFTVTEVTDTEVVLDGNHPMAGQDLFFTIRVDEIRDATKEELDHGHVHSEGDHHHH
jgi:FKBP-type peptidyl-prolyl cis-trans isomerase SlyD